MGGRKDLITAGLTLGALAGAEAKAKGKMSAIIATESGAVVSFTAADAAPVADLTAAIVPVQSGSGDPSPTNIRPISGWTECKVYRSGAATSDPTIYTVTFGSAGTVYGGTLDVTTGKLTVTMANIASYNGETLPGAWISDRDVYAVGTTPTIGAQVVYELATPLVYHLTPVEIRTLTGQNTIWADTGEVTVKYAADTKAFIDKYIAERRNG